MRTKNRHQFAHVVFPLIRILGSASYLSKNNNLRIRGLHHVYGTGTLIRELTGNMSLFSRRRLELHPPLTRGRATFNDRLVSVPSG